MQRQETITYLAFGLIMALALSMMTGVLSFAWQDSRMQRLDATNGEQARLNAQWQDLQIEKLELEKQLQAQGFEIQQAQQQLEQLKAELDIANIASGRVAVSGPGILVTVKDKPVPSTLGIQDSDLMRIVNELNAGGAEAIAISGERLGAATEIRTIGNVIHVGTQSIAPPYEIAAIGDPYTLERGLKLTGGVIEQLKVRMDISILQRAQLTLKAVREQRPFQYAISAEEGGR